MHYRKVKMCTPLLFPLPSTPAQPDQRLLVLVLARYIGGRQLLTGLTDNGMHVRV